MFQSVQAFESSYGVGTLRKTNGKDFAVDNGQSIMDGQDLKNV